MKSTANASRTRLSAHHRQWPVDLHLGYSDAKSAVAFTESYGQFQRAALEYEPSCRVKGALIDGFDSTTKSMRTSFPGLV
jgi:hypothetical protein